MLYNAKTGDPTFKPVNPKVNFPELEEAILNFWETNNVYQKTQDLRKKSKEVYTWLEGPPTANAAPHAGHALTRTLKDIPLRFQTMKGKFVTPRIGGWDCHGLPVELEIEKKLGFNSKQEIEDYGIKEFNDLCRESVLKYTDEWIQMSKRIGFWVDFDKSYITMTDDYIESVWWSLKTLFEKKLIFKGTHVAPYCPRCGTTLSSHELALGYKDIQDPAIFVKFKSLDFDDVSYLAWTTTPWTLLANVMLTVNPAIDYVIVEMGEQKYLLAEGLVDKVLSTKKNKAKSSILRRFKGKELEGKTYEPIFPFFKDIGPNAFKVTLADYVTLEEGTGIVHSAPAFGTDDAETGNRYGAPVVNPVDLSGKFKGSVPPLAGIGVKDADKKIIKMLKEDDKLFRAETYQHNYPHCWRCETPLLYYGTESWFIKMSSLRKNLIDNNNQIYWQPPYLKHGRFGNFIEKAVDWNLSRSRYWGTPLPAWVCDNCHNQVFVGSKQELEEKSGGLPDDFELHRPWVDKVKWECDCGGTFRRETYVIDSWYDSGSAPFAQYHYPYENKQEFEREFPYNFITEAIDQTRGWFYSLLAVGTALFDKPAYTSVLCMNHVLDKEGSKMSKSKGTAIAPQKLFDTAGADAMRWYLTSTPAWNPMRFGTKLVIDAQRRVLNKLWNVYSFFVTNANVDNYTPTDRTEVATRPDIDKWIVSRLQGLTNEVHDGYENLSFHTVVKALDYFIVEELSNWYVRRSRRRFYGHELTHDKRAGYDTLYDVLTTLARLMAPLTPYISEELYQNLELRSGMKDELSVHMQLFPTANPEVIDETLEKIMSLALLITTAARTARTHAGIKARQPLLELLIHLPENMDKLPHQLNDVIQHEINVKSLQYVENDEDFVEYKVQPLLKELAPKVKGAIKHIKPYLENMNRNQSKDVVRSIKRTGKVKLEIASEKWEFTSEELLVRVLPTEGYIMGESRGVEVFLKTQLTPELLSEGLARGIIRHIQELRKLEKLDYLDKINLYIFSENQEISLVIDKHRKYIMEETLAVQILNEQRPEASSNTIDGQNVFILVEKV